MEIVNYSASQIENPIISLGASIMQELDNLPPLSFTSSIQRVPRGLGHVKREVYTPKIVSIGPFYHGWNDLREMEEYKRRCLRDLIRMSNLSLDSYIQVVKQKEEEVRACYAAPLELSSDEFVKIIIVDAAFIILFLLRLKSHIAVDAMDRIFGRTFISQDIWLDMLLLENQLPFFILKDLFDHSKIIRAIRDGFQLGVYDLLYNFFNVLMHLEYPPSSLQEIRASNVLHFVDLVRRLHKHVSLQVPRQPARTTTVLDVNTMGETRKTMTPSITELHKAGVRFKCSWTTTTFHLEFTSEILKFPKISFCKGTEISIHNMLVFEKCYCESNYINDFIVIMDSLIRTPEDVDLLVKSKILENRLGDNRMVSLLIEELAAETFTDPDRFGYASLSKDLNSYCGSSRSKRKRRLYEWKENLRQTYFRTPWSSISVFAATFLLILTVIQTVCALIDLYSPIVARNQP